MNRPSRHLAFLSVCLAAGACATDSPTPGTTYDLYYLGGQSNMDGHGYVDQLPEELVGEVDRVMIFTGRTAFDDDPAGGVGIWEPLRPGHGTGFRTDGRTNQLSDRFGPELTFGRTMARLTPDRRIAIIKYSLGGSGLAPGVGYGSWDPDYGGGEGINQYDHALMTIQNAVSHSDIDGDGVPDRLVPAGIIWMQGEADAEHSQESADAYEENLARMMNLLRKALSDEDLPVVIGKITDSGMAEDGSVMDYSETVQRAQARFTDTDPCAELLTVTDNLSYPSNDAWHYDTEGYIRLGRAFAEAAKGLESECVASVETAVAADRAARDTERPNIILVVADDFGAPYHGFMGAEYVHTPNIDALAEAGVVFPNGYAPANHCRPSLRTFVSGLLPVQYDRREAANRRAFEQSDGYAGMTEEERRAWSEDYQFHSMRDIETLPGLLAEHGYLTWQGGKWWEFTYENGGFTHGMTTGWDPEDRDDEGWFLQFMGGQGRDLARVSNQAAYDFVDEAGDRPFFLWYAPELPHYPFDAPPQYLDIYADADMSESAKLYYANASWFDDRLGELFDYLDDRGKLENTLIVYVNDNGWEQEPHQEFVGDEMRFHNGGDKGKLGMYDQSFRTPIIFSWPGRIDDGQVREDLIHGADIPATILDYVGLETPDGMFGRSYRDVIAGGSAGSRDQIIGRVTQVRWEGDMMGRRMNGYWLRTGPWFFGWDVDTDETRLFQVEADPRSDANLSSEDPELVAEFKREIGAWRTAYDR